MSDLRFLEITCKEFTPSITHRGDFNLVLTNVSGDFIDQIGVDEIIRYYDSKSLLDGMDDDVMYEYLQNKGMIK